MKQALVLAATGLATTQAKLNDNFFLVDDAAAVMTQTDFLNKGGETLIAGSSSGLKFYYQSLLGVGKAQTIYKFNTYSIATPVTGATWPAAVALAPHQGSSNNAFATTLTTNSHGQVHLYEGSHSLWSHQQVLNAPDYSDYQKSFFGSSLVFDQNVPDTLFVGCGNCSTLVGKRNGAIYTYKQGSNNAWSQTQEITFTSLYQLGKNRLRADGDLLLADYQNIATDATGTKILSTLLLRKDAAGKYRPEQLLNAKAAKNVDSFDVEGDTIVLGSKTQAYSAAVTTAGAVYILGPTTLPPPAPGKPRPVQWSVQQVLWGTTPTNAFSFGAAVSIDGDRLSVLESGNKKNYIFKRDASVGKWSLQQTLVPTGATPSETRIKGGSMLTVDAANIELYDEFHYSSCLVVFLEDHFGDGWDTAQLVVTKPDGSKDYLANRCDTPNPYGLRYCPRNVEDAGLYRFGIVDGASKAKNYWELLWRVYNEDTGTWTVANWDTKLDFDWDSNNGVFNGRKVEKALPTNITCTRCPIKPTDKPTPALRRHLKDNDNQNNGGTVHPTHSPAPTLATSTGLGVNWQNLVLVGAIANDWFKADHRGASYYVSDAKSRKLIATGSICNWETRPATCWVDLPDGEYNVRVGGALDEDKASLAWRYCKSTNNLDVQTQLTIKIEDGACFNLGSHNYRAFCSGVDPSTDTALEFVVMGVQATDSLTSSDLSALSQAVAYTFPGVSSSDVRIESATPTGDGGYLVRAVVAFRHSTTGYDTLTAEGIETILGNVQTIMFAEGPRTIWSGLQTAERSSVFHSATSVQYVSSSIVGSQDLPLVAASVEEVVTYSDESTTTTDATYSSSSSTTKSSSTPEIVSYAGYAVAGVIAALVVGFFAFGRKGSQSEVESVPQQDSSMDTSGKRLQLKDLKLNAPSISDLKQLVKDEDDVLKIMLSRP